MQVRRSPIPFVVVAVLAALITVAFFRLPEAFVSQVQEWTPLNSSQAGWVYRLLAAAAAAQALYGGFVLLRIDRVETAIRNDDKMAAMTRTEIAALVSRQAAAMVLMTLVYGLAAFATSGQRAGFWLFVGFAVGQWAWYYRQAGAVAEWLSFQPEPAPDVHDGRWQREPPDYVPPIARALERLESSSKK